jgi:hypothetical protein
VTVGGVWPLLPFLVPVALLIRAAWCGLASNRDSRETFTGEAQWRAAERRAVAQVFGRLLLRRRTPGG